MSVKINDLDLRTIPFSKSEADLMVIQDPLDSYAYDEALPKEDIIQRLYISCTGSVMTGEAVWDLIEFTPVYNGEALPFSYKASNSAVNIDTPFGKAKLVFDGTALRVYSDNYISIQLTLSQGSGEFGMRDGLAFASYDDLGQFLFSAGCGDLRISEEYRIVELGPSIEGIIDGYICFDRKEVKPLEKIRPMDECEKENEREFTAFIRRFIQGPEAFQQAWLVAIYGIWCGMRKNGMIYTSRAGEEMYAYTAHQAYHAMAMCADVDAAVELLAAPFAYQEDDGMLPCFEDDNFVGINPSAPVQGLAALYIIDKAGDKFTKAHAEKLYAPMCRWIEWWFETHDGDRNGLAAYESCDECDMPDASVFDKGAPVESADLNAFLALCMASCAKLAKLLSLDTAAKDWESRERKLIYKMADVLWREDKFLPRLEATGEYVECASVLNYIPVILGKSLPKYISEKLVEELASEDKFINAIGFMSENRESPLYDEDDHTGMRGALQAEVQLLISPSLLKLNKYALSLRSAYCWCAPMAELGTQTNLRVIRAKLLGEDDEVYHGQDEKKDDKEQLLAAPGEIPAPGAHSTFADAAFLILSTQLSEDIFA